MRTTTIMAILATLIVALGVAQGQSVNLPVGGGVCGIEGLKLVALNGVSAKMEMVSGVDAGKGALKVTFDKTGDERRLLVLEAGLKGNPTGARAVALRYRLTLQKGDAPKLAVVVYDDAGGSWFKIGGPALVGDFADGRISVAALRATAFSASAEAAPPWDRVKRAWVGLVIDGPTAGVFELSQARFTDEPYKPTQPLRVTGAGPGQWSAGQDPAVVSTLTTPDEGPNGKPCMKYEWTEPGGRHMYAIPSTPVLATDLEGYTALRFSYRAVLPAGIAGMLVCVGEQTGAQYFADPPPPPSPGWTTVTIPFSQFKFATWTKDENGKLDLDQVNRVFIGCHGAAEGATAQGQILATDIEFVP